MNNIFVISDTHWHHANILKYSKREFPSIESMNEALIKNWNFLVKPDDTVFHLGDFAFCKYSELKIILRRLNGHKHFIMGNHDKVIKDNWDDLLNNKLFDSIQYYREFNSEGHTFILFHYPIASWNKKHHGAIHLHGHCHASFVAPGKILDVGVDDKRITSEYRPISITEIIKYMKNIPDVIIDHHGSRDDK